MLTLHSGFRDDSLLLWADSGDQLSAAAREVGLVSTRGLRPSTAWLPRETRIDVLPVALPQCLELLARFGDKKIVRPGLVIGADLLFWAAALRFAAGLVMRGQFLPGLETGAPPRARWHAVIAGAEVERMHALVEAMPPAARALTPHVAQLTLLRQFLDAAVDALVRSSGRARRATDFDSLHDQWLYALMSDDGVMQASPAEAQALASQIRQWQRPIQAAVRAPYRLCFRLEEPKGDADPWIVRYLLQATRDLSLLVPAEEAWKSASSREQFLSSLGQAAGIYPPVERSLRERAPEGCFLDVNGAHAFLRDTAATLEQSGFGVMLPSWWTRRGSRTRLQAKARVKSPKLQGGAGLTLESVVEFDWKLALGEESISRAELTALAKLKAPLVKLRGQWVEVDAAEIAAAVEFLRKKSEQATLGDIIRISLGADGTTGPIDIAGVTATGEIGEMLGQLNGTTPFEELPQPPEIAGVLRPYQRRGYSWLRFLNRWGLGACLADDMGLGKTIQSLALIAHEYSVNPRPVLLVCPTSVVGNWQKEAAKFAPHLPVLVHHGTSRHKGEKFAREAERHAIVLSSYSLLHRDFEALSGVEWSGVILDEAQNIKNPETKQARAARSIKSGWRVALTGTPVENNVGDLWSLMEFTNPGLLGTQSAFKKTFFLPIQVYGNEDAASRLRRITGPFILRRLKTDKTIISDLPEKLEMKVFCNLTKEQGSLYAAVVRDAEQAIKKAEGIERKGVVLATLAKLKQVCNHPAQFLKDNSAIDNRSGKLARLTEMIEETLEAGDRSLIFTQFTEMGDIIQQHLEGAFGQEVLFLHGGTAKRKRDEMVERFSGENGPRLFLLSLKAGGTGLNLTRANHVFHYDRWWNPAVENQATDRAFRIGQTKNVQVHKFICAGTLEEKIDEMIERKKGIAGQVVGAGEGWLTELSNAELKELFALRQEAIAE
jgi:SNF2 family DNA or RNA helicase